MNFQDIKPRKEIRAAAILTGDYVAGTVLEGAELSNQLQLYVDFTIGTLTSASIKIEFSDDNSNWYQETTDSISSGVVTESLASRKFTLSGRYRIAIETKDRFIRVSAVGEGTATGSSMAIFGVLGTA